MSSGILSFPKKAAGSGRRSENGPAAAGVRSLTGKSLLFASAAFLFLGAGCAVPGLSDIMTERNPFPKPETASFALEEGLVLTVRPTYLGVTGTVSDVLGEEAGRRKAEVADLDGARIRLEWETAGAEGSVAAERKPGAGRMLLPALWPEGEHDAGENGLLWLSEKAFQEIEEEGRTEWELGVADPLLERASSALAAFREAASRLFGASAGKTPFTVEVKERGIFPVRLDGRIESVPVVVLKNWMASFVVLDDAKNPLILKVNFDPAALRALEAFSALGVDPRAVGYEITAVERAP